MNKREYLTRVFQGQVNSLKNEIKYKEVEIEDLQIALREQQADLDGAKALLKLAEEELERASKS